MKKLMTAVIIAATSLSGCATMFSGKTQSIEVRTQNDTVGQKLDNEVFLALSSARIHHVILMLSLVNSLTSDATPSL